MDKATRGSPVTTRQKEMVKQMFQGPIKDYHVDIPNK